MKTMLTAIIALAVCLPIAARETTKPKTIPKCSQPSETKTGQGDSTGIKLSTGSLLPNKVHQAGQITDGPCHVQVIDSATIRNSGASDLSSLLKRRGAIR